MQRLAVKISLAFLSMVIILGLTGVAAAIFGWILPGSLLFPLQEQLEGVTLVGSSARRAEKSLDLVERRIEDLKTRAGSEHELAALEALGSSIDQATQAIAHAPEDQVEALLQRLEALLEQAWEGDLKEVAADYNALRRYTLALLEAGVEYSLGMAQIAEQLTQGLHRSAYVSA